MSDTYLDDLKVGDTWTGPPFVMDEADMLRFAGEFDDQPMHTDPATAATGRFGGIIASGWHVLALMMKDFVATKPFGDTPLLGIGAEELQWLKPVRPGDTLTVRREVIEVTRSHTKPDRGTIRMWMVAANQDGEDVLSFVNLIQMPARP